MLRKIITAAVASLMLATVAVPAFAAPRDNTLDSQLKTLNKEIKTLQHALSRERALDQALYGRIKNTRNMIQVDREKLAAYRAEMDPLAAQLASLTKQLCAAKKSKDEAQIVALKAGIKDTLAKINAVKAKYPDIAKALKHKHKAVCDAQVFKTQIEPKYAELKALVSRAVTINADIARLTKSYRAAVKAGDTAKAQAALDQLTSKKTELKDNLAARIALRAEITKLLKECTFKIN